MTEGENAMDADGNRTAQIISGTVVSAIAAVLLLGPQVSSGKPPRDLVIYVGVGLVIVGLLLIVPVGMGRIGREARRLWHEFRGHE